MAYSAKRICLVLGLVILPFVSSGCASQKAINAYVDAVMLEEVNQDQQALDKLRVAVKENSKFAMAYSLMGDIYQKNKEFPKSADSYEKATALNRWSYKDFYNLGKVYQTMKKFTSAVNAYVRATQIKPASVEAHLGAATSYYELKDYKNAIKFGSRAGQLDPNMAQPQQLLGDIYSIQKDYDKAISYYKRAVEIDTNSITPLNSLALAYLRAGRNDAARELLNASVESSPNATSYQHLGFANLKLKDFDAAIAAYRKAVELDPNDWSAHKGLGVALMIQWGTTKDQALHAEALNEWKKSLELHADQPKLKELLDKYQQAS